MRSIQEIRNSVTSPSLEIKPGDYVFACKWSDADPRDRWIVDIVKENSTIGNGRPALLFEKTGVIPYYYATKISAEEGVNILTHWAEAYP